MVAFISACVSAIAQNPIIQTSYTADPAPYVHGDTVYLYTSHDEDTAEGFLMKDWLLYTSTDMVNWTDHGAVASLHDFVWGPQDNGAWAIQTIERGGKWYMYCPLHCNGIGVLESDSPYGPFHDPIGHALISQSIDDIDPTVWIDTDGQAYLYWGNPNLYLTKLAPDMISTDGKIVKNPGGSLPEDYQEGPWFYKRGKWYYMAYASTCCPEGIGYAMSKKPTGPWTKAGTIMGHYPQTNGNHPGIIQFKGHDYLFGHSYGLHQAVSSVFHERRSVCVAELHYNADGTIDELPYWDEIPALQPVGSINPYERVEAETMAWSDGLKTERRDSVGMVVTQIHNTDYLLIRNVDFGHGATKFIASVATENKTGVIELRLDRPDGTIIGTCSIEPTYGWNKWEQRSCKVEKIGGHHDLYMIFRGQHKARLFDFDWWQFK